MKFTFNQHIGVFENAFDKGYCDELIKIFDSSKDVYRREDYWETDPSLVGQAVDSAVELTHILEKNPQDSHTLKVRDFFFTNLGKYWEMYSRKCNIYPHIFSLDGFKLQKTEKSEGYHIWHHEYPTSFTHLKDKTLTGREIKNLYTRVAAYTLYLNDVEEGGETEFLMQSYRLPSRMGTLCIFPAGYTHVHRGNPPLSGSKYIMTGWLTLTDVQKDE